MNMQAHVLVIALAFHTDAPASDVHALVASAMADLPVRVVLADHGDVVVSLLAHNSHNDDLGAAWRFGPRCGRATVYVDDLRRFALWRHRWWDVLRLCGTRFDAASWAKVVANVTLHEIGHCLGLPHGPGVMRNTWPSPRFVERFTDEQQARIRDLL